MLYRWMHDNAGARAFIDGSPVEIFRVSAMFADPGGIANQIRTGWDGVGQANAPWPDAPFEGKLIPSNYPGYWEQLAALDAYIAAAGKRMLFCCLADCQFPELASIDQQAFLDEVDGRLLITNIGEAGNEYGKNGWNPRELRKPTRLLWSTGSVGTQRQPATPPWDIAPYETSRDDYFARTGAADIHAQYIGDNSSGPGSDDPNTFEFTCNVSVNEMIGIFDVDQPGRSTANPRRVWQFVAGCKAAGAGFVILHVRAGIAACLPTPGGAAEACIAAAVDAAVRVTNEFAFGEFLHGNFDDTEARVALHHFDRFVGGQPENLAGAVRTYQFRAGARGLDLVFDEGPDWTPKIRDGFTCGLELTPPAGGLPCGFEVEG